MKPTVSLSELVDSDLSVELNGKEYKVKPIDGFAYHLLQNNQGGDQAVEIMYRIAARCLAPGMTKEQVFGTEDETGLSATQVGAVVQVAQSQVKTVEALASPNSGRTGNKGKRASSPASHQPTP